MAAMKSLIATISAVFLAVFANAQGPGGPGGGGPGGGPGGGGPGGGGPGGPPPIPPLGIPPAPAGNPVSASKIHLGKALFWDEQLSSTRTVSCGTCHQPASGGVDPRAILGGSGSTHPGADGVPGTSDDVTGSPGVILNNADGTYSLEDFFGMTVQVTGRYAPSAINAGFSPSLFWDGRAGDTFRDPESGAVVLSNGAALESQAAGPPLSGAEMAHQGRDWTQVAERIEYAKPLALSPSVPSELESWIANRNYPALFAEAFGDAAVTPSRVVMAIATYERTLVSNQASIDDFIAGDNAALTPLERQGLQVFAQSDCVDCHGGNRFTDDRFHYIGVRPVDEDLGRFHVTGNNGDRGRMRTPSLRNLELRGAFMHNGGFGSITDVVAFYNRGGDFDAPNKNRSVRPLQLNANERNALIAFLGRPLTDPRVAEESGPFTRPALYAGSRLQPAVADDALPGDGGFTPSMVAIEPALSGNPSFTVGVAGGPAGGEAVLVVDWDPVSAGNGPPPEDAVWLRHDLSLSGEGDEGYSSRAIALPAGENLAGRTIHGRWFVEDGSGWAASASFETELFGQMAGAIGVPPDVTASDGTFSDRIEVSWRAVEEAIRYAVYRSESNAFVESRLLGETAGTEWIDQSPPVGGEAFYWVVAIGAHEVSEPGGADEGSVDDVIEFSLTATEGASSESILLDWEQVTSAVDYMIERKVSSDTGGFVELARTDETSFQDNGGVAERDYSYRVFALDGEGNPLGRSGVATAVRRLPVPTGLTASEGEFADRVVLSWNSVEGADGYGIYRDGGAGFLLIGSSATPAFGDQSVVGGKPYRYRITAVNPYGESEPSQEVSGSAAMAAPAGLSAHLSRDGRSVLLAWTGAPGSGGFVIYRSTSGDASSAEIVGTTTFTSFEDTSIESGVDYTYWVASVDAEGEESLSAPVVRPGATFQPDLAIGRTARRLLRDDHYSVTAAGQRVGVASRRFRAMRAYASVQNDGTTSDEMRLRGTNGGSRFRVTYSRRGEAAGNVTGAVVSGRARASLEEGETERYVVIIRPVRGRLRWVRRGVRTTVSLLGRSSTDSSAADRVQVRATTRR